MPTFNIFIRIYHKLGFHCHVFGLSQLNFDLNLVFEVGKTLGRDEGGGAGGQKIEERWGGLENWEFRVLAWSNSKSQTF